MCIAGVGYTNTNRLRTPDALQPSDSPLIASAVRSHTEVIPRHADQKRLSLTNVMYPQAANHLPTILNVRRACPAAY